MASLRREMKSGNREQGFLQNPTPNDTPYTSVQ